MTSPRSRGSSPGQWQKPQTLRIWQVELKLRPDPQGREMGEYMLGRRERGETQRQISPWTVQAARQGMEKAAPAAETAAIKSRAVMGSRTLIQNENV